MGATIVYRNGYYFAAAPADAACAGPDRLPDRHRHGHRKRDDGRDPGGRHDGHRQRGARAGSRRPDRDAPLDGRAHRADRRASDRGRGRRPAGRRRAPVMGDRLEAETFAIAAAITRGEVTLQRHQIRRTSAHSSRYASGSGSPMRPMRRTPAARAPRRRWPLRAVDVRTDPYPGFATDFQAPLSVLLTQADGVSTIHETIFEDRLDHTGELVKMGADIELLDERRARITGPTALRGAEVASRTCERARPSFSPRWRRRHERHLRHRARRPRLRADRGQARRARRPDQPHRGRRSAAWQRGHQYVSRASSPCRPASIASRTAGTAGRPGRRPRGPARGPGCRW